MSTMLSSSLRRAAWTPIVPISGIARAAGGVAGSNGGASSNNGGQSQPQQQRVRQRRYSSSSSKPSDGSRGLDASSSQTPAKGVSSGGSGEGNGKREGKSRRRGKAAQQQQQQQQQNAAFSKLPSVPSTQYQQPHDVHVASFFSIHRPISVSNTVPPTSSQDNFDAIFSSRKSHKAEQEDVMYTLSSAVQNMDSSAQPFSESDGRGHQGQRLEVDVQPYDTMNMADIRLSVEELTKRLRPFHPPPPPVPFDQAKKAAAEHNSAKQSEASSETSSYSTVLTIHESTDATGRKTYEAHTTPFVRAQEMDAPGTTSSNEAYIDEAPRSSNKGTTYIERLRNNNRTMHAISTRRRRKDKMKKHKYKKLLRRTRTLRRKLDKA